MMTILEFSESRAAIAKALVKAQIEMGDVIKNANNPAFKSKYADLGAVVEAVQPAYLRAGIAIIQAPAAEYEGGASVTVETLLLHESGEWVRSFLTLRPTKTDPQGIGSAITYGRRYQLLAMSGAAPEDDDGNAASGAAASRRNSGARNDPQGATNPPADAKPATNGQTRAAANSRPPATNSPEEQQRSMIAWIETKLGDLRESVSDAELQEIACAVRTATIDALPPDADVPPAVYEWRALGLEEMREFWKRVPKKPRTREPAAV